MVEFTNLNSGIPLYKEKAPSQSFGESGGKIPDIKSHLVMDKPDSVHLVNPPAIIIKPTSEVININQNKI